jgi:hypothetical protein
MKSVILNRQGKYNHAIGYCELGTAFACKKEGRWVIRDFTDSRTEQVAKGEVYMVWWRT